jgi:hypothetical protein
MADETITDPVAPALADLASAIVAEFVRPEVLQKLRASEQGAAIDQVKDVAELALGSLGDMFEWGAEKIIQAGSVPTPITRALANAAVDTLLGQDGSIGSDTSSIGRKLVERLAGDGTELRPGYDRASAFMGLLIGESIEAWTRGVAVELISGMIPGLGGMLDGVENFAKLQDIVEQMLGGGRLVRQVLGPIIHASTVVPAEWQTNKTYRPNLLGTADAVRQFLRGRWTREQMAEELARQGWSDDRIEALVNSQRRFHSVGDVSLFQERGYWTLDQATQHLKDQGYTDDEASDALRAFGLRRIDQLEAAEASALVDAYASRNIDEGEFARLLSRAVTVETERALVTELAELRRALNVKQLSSGRVRALAKQGVLSVADYRATLRREGWDEFAVDAEELSLMQELNEAREIAELKAEQEEQKRLEREAAAAEKARREAELAARERVPTGQEIRRAYVRGLVSRERFISSIELERMKLAPDDLAILIADADLDRAEHVAREEAAAAAAARKEDPSLPLADYEASVLRGVLTTGQYVGELVARGFDEPEVNILVARLNDRIDQQREADAAKAAAAEKLAIAGLSLADMERAVRLGLRTRADYAEVLDRAQLSTAARALVLDLLDATLEQDAEARRRREEEEAAAALKGISLAQRRRAVIAGIRPRAYYEQALLEAGWPGDDLSTELALLDLEVAEAEEARRRRAEAEAASATATLTLAQRERAVKLGLLPPDALRAYLESVGYEPDDVELLVAMVVAEIPDVRAGQQLRRAIAGDLLGAGVTVGDLETAVRRGLRTLDDYRTALALAGKGADAVDLLAQLLAEEVAIDLARLRERIAEVLDAVDDAPSLDDLVDAVRVGELTAEQLRDVLVLFGVDADAATVYARLALTV